MIDDRDPVDLLAEEFADRLRRGERPSVSDYAAKHPEHAEQIRVVLPAVAQMEQLKLFRKTVPKSNEPPDRLGDFRIVRELGRGGMGIVFEAVQESLGRRVALKVLATHAQLDPERRERFIREAKAAARLHHTNIVPVFGVGEQDGLPYYVMQLIPGHGLNTLVKRWHEQTHGETLLHSRRGDSTVVTNGQTPPRTPAAPEPTLTDGPAPGDWNLVASIGVQTAQALHYAHQQGVLHRDVKPANLLHDERGQVWVVDFGLAKLANLRGLTATGHILGTLQYLAPECLLGKADARSDVYGLGATLYELLTLSAPFDGENPAQIMKLIADSQVAHPRKRNPHIPRDLETIVLKSMNRDPNKRYATAKELADDLEAFLNDRPIRARRESAPERVWRWARHHPAVAALSCCTVAALALAAVLGWSGYVRTKKALEAEEERRTEVEVASAKLKANLSLSLGAFEKVFIAAGGDDFRPRGPFGPPGGGFGGFVGGPFQNEAADKSSVLEAVLAFYDKFAEQNATDVALQFEAAKAHRRVGEMNYWLNRGEKSQAAYKRSKALLDGVFQERREDPDVRYELMLWYSTSPVEQAGAEAQLVKAVELADGFTAEPRRWTAGGVYMRLGIVREQNKNSVGAEAAFAKAVALLKLDGDNRPPNVLAEQMYCRQRIAGIKADRGETSDARKLLEQMADELRSQIGGGPQARPMRDVLSGVLNQLADLYQRRGEESAAARVRLELQRLREFPGHGGPGGGPPFGKGGPKK